MSLGSMEQRTEGIRKQASELIEQAYQRGYKKAEEDYHIQTEKDRESSYQFGIEVGRKEAWEAAKKLVPMDYRECFVKYTASEAIEKIKAYEEKKREEEETSDLHIGDEVTFLTIGGEIITGVITGEYHDTHEFRIMRATDGGECYCCKAKRTGRHFPEIAEVLEKMKESDNCCMSNSDLMERYPNAMADKENAE